MKEMLEGSVLSALSTGLGALLILQFSHLAHKWRDVLIAFTAGVMVATCTFSLIPESLESGGLIPLFVGLLLGLLALTILEQNLPHAKIENTHSHANTIDKSWLIIFAVTLHNIPEGLSVGVSYATNEQELGNLVSLAIGLQNIPEGFLVALYLLRKNFKKWEAFLLATLTGGIEILFALLGYNVSNQVEALVPFGIAFAAGSMFYIIYKELIPESHGDGNEIPSTYSFVFGVFAMIAVIHLFNS